MTQTNKPFPFKVKLTIPANAVALTAPAGHSKWFALPLVEVLIGIGNDHTATLLMDTETYAALLAGEPVHFSEMKPE